MIGALTFSDVLPLFTSLVSIIGAAWFLGREIAKLRGLVELSTQRLQQHERDLTASIEGRKELWLEIKSLRDRVTKMETMMSMDMTGPHPRIRGGGHDR